MRKPEFESTGRVTGLARRLWDLTVDEMLDGNIKYEEACSAIKMLSVLMVPTRDDLPGRCFLDFNTAFWKIKIEEAEARARNKAEVEAKQKETSPGTSRSRSRR